MTVANGNDPVHRALDLFVYAPVGFALMAYQRVPTLVSEIVGRGMAQLGEAEARVNQAKMIGQVAVTFGSRQLRREVDSRLEEACKKAEFLAGYIPGLRSDDEDDDLLAEPLTGQGSAASAAPAAGGPPPAPSSPFPSPAPTAPSPPPEPSTPFPSPAPEVSAPPPPAADLPIPEYDGLSASQVVSRLSGLTETELDAVAAYEAAGRRRKTVLAAIDRLRS